MNSKPFDAEKFKQLLDGHHDWPCTYTFKFVIPKGKLSELREVFERDEFHTKDSKKGNYISVTINKYVISSSEVMSLYEECSEITGLISL